MKIVDRWSFPSQNRSWWSMTCVKERNRAMYYVCVFVHVRMIALERVNKSCGLPQMYPLTFSAEHLQILWQAYQWDLYKIQHLLPALFLSLSCLQIHTRTFCTPFVCVCEHLPPYCGVIMTCGLIRDHRIQIGDKGLKPFSFLIGLVLSRILLLSLDCF